VTNDNLQKGGKMKLVEIKIEELTGESFKPYGDIIDIPNRKPDFSDDDSDLWCGIGEVKVEKGASQFCWLDVKRQRPFLCNNLECHINTSETMIPVSGQSVVVVALPEQDSVSLNLPDPKSIKAFFVNGSKGFNFKPRVWHWLPYPLSTKASFILLFKKGTPEEDLRILNLNKECDLSIKIIL
jgi:ureidoglycolate lyase